VTVAMYQLTYGPNGWETVGEPIVSRPVWGLDAGAGICEGCEAECGDTERHYYCLPETGTVGLCLDCGPEERS
jgi:hypothetical protein